MLKAFLAGTVTAATGKTIAIVISKNGGAFGNPSGGATNATEVSAGWYYVDLSTTDTGTLGDLVVRGTEAAIDATERLYTVCKATNGGWTGIPDAVAGANGGLPVLSSSATTLNYTVPTVTTVGSVSGSVGSVVALVSAQLADGVTHGGSDASFTMATISSLGSFTVAGAFTATHSSNDIRGITLADASLTTAKLGAFVLAKTTNISGFNDIAATDVVSGGAITTSGGVAVAKLADGVTHGGSTAILSLTRVIVAASSNNSAVTLTGSGSGHGMRVTGGSTGHGVFAQGGSTSGSGASFQAPTSGDGISASGGSDFGDGISGSSTVGNGMTLAGASINGTGLYCVGGSSSGHGAYFRGIGTDSSGLRLEGTGNGLDMLLVTPATNLSVTVSDKTGFSLSSAYDPAKTAAQAGDAMTLTVGAGNALVAAVAAQVASDHGSGSYETATGFSTLDAAGVRTAVGLASANLDTQFSNIPAGILDLAAGIETGLTVRQGLRLIVAAEGGKTSGGGTTTFTIRNIGDSKDRVTATVDEDGNRSAVTLDLT